MTIEETITRYKNNAEYERTHGNLQGCLEFRQLAKWLEKYQKIAELYDYWQSSKCEYTISCMENIGKVLKDG